MDLVDIIGFSAAIVGNLIFLPQVYKTIKTKDTKSLSLPTFILVTLNNSLWLSYGFLSTDTAIILSQVFVFPVCLIILIYKLKYG